MATRRPAARAPRTAPEACSGAVAFAAAHHRAHQRLAVAPAGVDRAADMHARQREQRPGQADVCGGPLRIQTGVEISVVCARCRSQWGVADLVNVGRVSPLNLWESVTNIAAMLDIPDRTVRHWAATGKIRRDSLGQVNHADAWRHAHRTNQ